MRLIDADRLRNIAISNRDVEMVYEIDHSPTVERPHGEWIFKHNSADIWCSNCDENFDEIPQKFLFCPNCGSDNRPREEA